MSDLLDDDLFLGDEDRTKLDQLQNRCNELEVEKEYLLGVLQMVYDYTVRISEAMEPFFKFAEEKHGMFYFGPTFDRKMVRALERAGVTKTSISKVQNQYQEDSTPDFDTRMKKYIEQWARKHGKNSVLAYDNYVRDLERTRKMVEKMNWEEELKNEGR